MLENSVDTASGKLITGSLGAQYELREKLGEGGYSQVYVAWDTQLQREVAVKLLKTSGQGETESLLHEARLAARLHHAAFVKIFAIATLEGLPAIVMERVPGQTLRQLIEQGPIGADQALRIIDEVADAMAEAHQTGLVHGDIKPSNLMQEPNGSIRILDFGIAHQTDPLQTQTNYTQSPIGTPAYMAPEQLLGQRAHAGSDIFALGLVLYELVTGTRPDAALNGFALASARIHGDTTGWPLPADLAPWVVSLIRAMTARDPAARPGSMAAIRQRITDQAVTLDHIDPPPAKPTGTFRLTWKRVAAILAVSGALAAGGGGIWWLAQATSTPTETQLTTATHLERGEKAMQRFDRDGALDEAIIHFKAVLQALPHHAAAAAWLSLAYSLRYAGDSMDETWLKQAEVSAKLALQQDDQLALAHVAQARVLGFHGQHEAALAALDLALKLDPYNPQALDAKINRLISLERYIEAKAVLDEALRRYPQDRLFIDLLGTWHYRQANYAAAEAAFRQSIQVQPDAVYAYANLNAALLRQNRLDEALSVLQRGLQIRPSGRLYSNLGTALYAKGDYLGAAEAFERAVSSSKGNPKDYLRWANLADALRWVPGREHDAQKAYAKASRLIEPLLRRSPDDITLLSRAGLYEARQQLATQAIPKIVQSLAKAPNNPDVHFRAALAYELLGQRQAAIDALIKAKQFGYPEALIETEPDLVELRRDHHYQQISTER
ncbi:serine/threonine-protein kinase [Chitinivorax tropicus]|uniref:Serine/threonine-protein kinase n=1 Tax=Chitinivorax tropicus TaxID=714531 RepID=A0A840MSF0_9PROT|nr:serine/threonine-protein kinase [Chitinivorax tropicus]MBB5020087.1 serine/threonine-protein kinase [Chitinivorax tropicus]